MLRLCPPATALLANTVLLAVTSGAAHATVPPTAQQPWRALHLINHTTDAALDRLARQLPQLARLGINCVILEINYGFDFKSHPELRAGEQQITSAGAKRFVQACHANGIELVPQFQCLGHQSWKQRTAPLLAQYPELDLTPGAFPSNHGIYCREWDPMNPRTNRIVFALIDEIIEAFAAQAFHVGMDEVFLLSSPKAPSTRDLDPADVFAKVVKDLRAHITEQRGLTMLMWADRLIDGNRYDMGAWEASKVGTAAAVDKIPKDIILCPWHYELRDRYDSLPMLEAKGFCVLPAGWKNTAATLALIRDAQRTKVDDRLVGHIFTTWSTEPQKWTDFEPLVQGMALLNATAAKER